MNARRVLDEDHYDLQEVKDRIIEFLAVRKLFKERGIQKDRAEDGKTGKAMGAILCFVGPPGWGRPHSARVSPARWDGNSPG